MKNFDVMKPYGRDKKVNFPGKTDYHPRKGFVNWWEKIACCLSRSAMKQKLKKEIDDGKQ